MIKQIEIRGFKDQRRAIHLSGMDLFTSSDINGVGKSSVLESVKLALLGEIPGKVKSLDDLLQYTSFPEMSVKIQVTTPAREMTIERRFLREAKKGEKRPIVIDQSNFRYEEGDLWIRDMLGAASLGFDPYEFLNLTDQKKRQWIISNSPESRVFNREILYAILFARLVEIHFGAGLVREQLLFLGLEKLEQLVSLSCKSPKGSSGLATRLLSNVSEITAGQDSAWVARIRARLDKVLNPWLETSSAEENIAVILSRLKAEILRLKNAVCEQSSAISCLAAPAHEEIDKKIKSCRENIRLLIQAIEKNASQLQKILLQIEERERSQGRLKFLQDSIDEMVLKICADPREEIRSKLRELEARFVDTRGLQNELDRLNDELNEYSEIYNRQESNFSFISGNLKIKRAKLRSLPFLFREEKPSAMACVAAKGCGSADEDKSMTGRAWHVPASDFHCPIAAEIKCETDFRPYREILVKEIKALEQNEAESKPALEKAQESLRICGGRIRDLRGQVQRQLQANDACRQEIRILQEKFAAEERAMAKAQGTLEAYREEVKMLRANELVNDPAHSNLVEAKAVLEAEKKALMKKKQDEEENLISLLREQGRVSAANELVQKRNELEAELKDTQRISRLLGPDGVQKEMAERISGALEREVNEALKLIDANFEFTLDLSGARFLMGWNRDGKVIPFKTINSAHFIMFIVPFLAVVLNRIGRVREREGLSTLKVLCIEAEAMTTSNLAALLKGLSVMKAKGYLDNVLVAHYTSMRDPERLSGFKEHILTQEGEESL